MADLTPSILAADLLHLGREIEDMLANGISRLHFDVMDAHFVPNLSFSPALCGAIKRQYPQIAVDAHLMMSDPLAYVKAFADAGADLIVLHQEVLPDIPKAMGLIRSLGIRRGISVKPGTPAETLMPYLDCLDYILVMTVEPGFGGQRFMTEQLEKIRALRAAGFAGEIAVDGGVNLKNAAEVCRAGGNVLVMGTSYFQAEDRAIVARAIKELA